MNVYVVQHEERVRYAGTSFTSACIAADGTSDGIQVFINGVASYEFVQCSNGEWIKIFE